MNTFESTKRQIFVGSTTHFNSRRLHLLHQNLYFLEMNSRLSSSTPFLLLLQFSLLLFSIKFPPCWSLDSFSSCSKPFNCGNITNIDYPFWGDDRVEACGHPDLHLKCDENKTTTIKIKDVVYEVLKIDQNTQILQIKRDDFFESKGLCSPKYPNTTFDSQLFEYAPGFAEITINYDCPALKGVPGYFSCPDWSTYKDVFIQVASETHPGCSSNLQVGIGVNYFGDFWSMEEALIREGFGVKYKVDTLLCKEGCTGSGGVCVHDVDSNKPTCHCPDGNSRESPCPPQRPPSAQLKGTNPTQLL
nr:LEAF RUST 10 DISEASE-RESISTANCE LOCUS RECEPTOR-LIKE PROTEIN KINASE-like 1.3 [Ziziphus jujuba var. spinosa]